MIFDPRGMKLQDGSFTGLKLHFLRKGHSIDLATREVQ
jgi:hypothetical protein